MSIQKKSLISALKTTKKANVASTEVAKGENRTSMKLTTGALGKSVIAPIKVVSAKMVNNKRVMKNFKKL